MNQVIEFFKKLFDTSDWPPRWNCGKWTEFHGWFYIISDLMVWSAYFAIPVIILRYISRRKGIRFHKVYFLFAAFILACGLTHFIDAVMFWFPAYRFNALVRFITGVASWFTVYHLFKILPAAFSLKSPAELENEVEQRRMAEEELTIKNKQLNEAQDIAKLGHWEWDIGTNKLEWSEGLYKVYGFKSSSDEITFEKFMEKVHPDDQEYVSTTIKQVFENKEFPEYYHRIVVDGGEVRTVHAKGELILDAKGEVLKMLGTAQDVTEQKSTEHELLSKTKELQAVNSELEKFAYIASHDLQEPLRKMITYTSLLEKEIQGVAGEKSLMYLDKIVGSSERMQNLISDILNLSRFSSSEITFEQVNINEIVHNVMSDLEVVIQTSGASINLSNLPVVEANASQMNQLFQNLISNGIKFRKPDVKPVITIQSEIVTGDLLKKDQFAGAHYKFLMLGNQKVWTNEKFCRIIVKDNGIGFNEEYADRIFEVFQRLHNKSQYEGTGIGLAICKKIVENHHGTITANSKPGEGAIFIIVLPASQKNFTRRDNQN
jgi:PAS domain S-box-containing protein